MSAGPRAAARVALAVAACGVATWMPVALGASGAPGADEDAPVRPPNVVVFFADDLGHGDLGCYGSPTNRTPHLDRLAAEGVRFTDAYSASPGCTPSRAALLTGCQPQRVGLPSVLSPRAQVGLSPDETTMAEVLAAKGYATAAIGKWHLGDAPNLMPWNHGFEDVLCLPYSNDMWTYNWGTRDVGLIGRDRWGPIPLWSRRPGEAPEVVARDPRQDSLTPRYTARALEFVRANADRPFFLYLAWSHPHTPLAASAPFLGASGAGLYGDVLLELDDSVGRVVDLVEELGLARDTVVVFASDNGPWTRFGDHGGSTGGLRGDKGTTFEGGVRVPLIAWGPGRVGAGRVEGRVASLMDLLPTLARLAGASPGDGAWPTLPIDGVDITALLQGTLDPALEERLLVHYWPDQLQALRHGRWKLHLPHGHRTVVEAGRDGHPGVQGSGRIGLSLFDLAADPGETTDVAAEHPEVVARLQAWAEAVRERLGDRGRVGSEVRAPGRAIRGAADAGE